MPLIYNKALDLTEAEIRMAMENTKSNTEAARWIGCHLITYRKYARQYFDKESGKNLYELHKNQSGKGMVKEGSKTKRKKDIFEILDGKHPTYPPEKVKERIVSEGIFPEKCSKCGFDERRVTDFRVPLVLIYEDGDMTNHKSENLELICYNCYFLTYDEVFGKLERIKYHAAK